MNAEPDNCWPRKMGFNVI